MNRLPEIELMRLLHGELPPERTSELHERLAREPELAAELRRLEATWDRLELPPAAPTPRGFAREVTGRAESGGIWSLAPTRIRAAGFALLAAGLALGIGLTSGLSRPGVETGLAVAATSRAPTVPAAATPAASTSPAPPALATGERGGTPAPVAPTPTAPAIPTTPAAPAPNAAPDRIAELDYDLPTDDGAYADQGTLADDFWQAFGGTDSETAAEPETGSGSEDL
jgi:anti-sigma factor RsiW